MLVIKQSPFGRGVFATQKIKAGTVVEEAPILLIPVSDEPNLLEMQLSRYQYGWTRHLSAIALGMGSIYNHSSSPNIESHSNFVNQTIVFTALRDIEEGEELVHNYGYDPSLSEKHRQAEEAIGKLEIGVLVPNRPKT